MNFLNSLFTALYSTFSYGPTPLNSISLDNSGLQDGVIIIGGGIVGLSTAYSLALDLKEAAQSSAQQNPHNVPRITLVESSDRLCPAASSQATGGLGDFGFGTNKSAGVAGVGSLSYKMHMDMAAKYNGEECYGFSRQVVAADHISVP